MDKTLTVEIRGKDFILGESQSDLISDKGFSPDSYGLNLLKTKGEMFFIETPTDRGSSTLTGNLIASAFDKNFLGNDLYFLDDEGAFYTLNATTFTKRQTVTADTFTLGTSDMLQFLGNTYATTATRVVQLTGSDLATVDSSWWTGLTTSYRHPLERVENTMYIGDANLIHSWDGTTSTSAFVTLPTDVNITSLRKHPDGVHLIAFCGLTANYSHLKGQGGRIYLIDTSLRDWVREIETESQVEGSRLVGGIVYVTYGAKLGYFTGDGIKSLKNLTTSQTTYSQSMSNMEDILLIRDGVNVLAFGDLGAGNVWWNLYRNTTNSNNVQVVAYKGGNVVCYGFSDGAGAGILHEVDYDNAGILGTFYSNRYSFGRRVMIRRIVILHDVSASGGTTAFSVYYRDIENTSNLLQTVTYNSQSVSKTTIECQVETDFFQFGIVPSNDDTGYKLIRIYYAAVE